MKIDTQVGPQVLLDGATPASVRVGPTGELVVQQLNAKYAELTRRGLVFHASVPAAGVAPGTVIGTTAALSLYNPQGSGKNLVVLRGSLAFISGTLGAGTVFYCANGPSVAAPTGGTAITPVPGLVGSSNVSVALARSGSTLPASPSIIAPFCSLTALLTTTAVQPYTVTDADALDGALIVPPGSILSFEAVAAAGTSPLVVLGLTWAEVPA